MSATEEESNLRVLTEVKKGDTLIYMEGLEEWTQVATMDGYVGYVRKKDISEPSVTEFARDFQKEEYTYLTSEEPVNLAWHQVTTQEANAYFADATANVSGVNVISPTWFYLQDTAGNIADISSAEYVNAAHEKGMQVWGLIDNFTADVSTTETLSQLSSRQNIISQLMAAAKNVGLDGINVDFETLSEDAGPHFLEFLRELSIECHKNNLVLSVDNPVPEDFTSHYDRREQGQVVDYVITSWDMTSIMWDRQRPDPSLLFHGWRKAYRIHWQRCRQREQSWPFLSTQDSGRLQAER